MAPWLERLQGRPLIRDLGNYRRQVAAISAMEPQVAALDDAEIRTEVRTLRERIRCGEAPGAATLLFFALYREAARRTLGERPYDEQLIAGLALHEGRLAEMQTGEGKTLAAVAPAALHALDGRGAHVLTFNDYLARRDAAWMEPVYRMLGLTVAAVQAGMSAAERRAAYRADVTYATAKEAGFDELRGQLAREPFERVRRPYHYAIVDEADSILIDEARVPLVIAGDLGHALTRQRDLVAFVASLRRGVHYDLDEHARNVDLDEHGLGYAEERLGCGDLLAPENLELLTEINCALHARVLLHRDVDYLVRGDRIELIDELTGRVVDDRHLPDGLQAAVEAKEGLAPGSAGTVLGSMTLQHFLTRYPTLAGMTATARHSADELHELYGLKTVIVPPHRPSIRVDHPDRIFTHREAKQAALVAEIARVHRGGRPVLVGTASVEESERLADAIGDAGVRCSVLNARNDEDEARIVAGAGAPGAVTISTNMAGRGTDIRLGGPDESRRDEVLALGGLYVIGTNRHDSERIDDQLRGRAGRQGDPGSTRFFVSLDDPLIARFGVRDLIPEPFRPPPSEHPVDHPVIRREIRRAQNIADNENLEIRRTLGRYAWMVEQQRQQLHRRRDEVLMRKGGRLDSACPERFAELVETHGRETAEAVEREIILAWIDRTWREHLAEVDHLRESIHLKSVVRLDPLAEFQKAIIDGFDERRHRLDRSIEETFRRVRVGDDGGIDLDEAGLGVPTSTWTYVVSDDPFRDQLLATLGGTAMGIGLVFNFPLVVAWWLYRRWRSGRL